MQRERVAVFPGSFDPPTRGHLDIISRGAGLFDRLVVGVLENPDKRALLGASRRVELLEGELRSLGLEGRVEVDVFSGLAVHFAESREADWILRGLRSSEDLGFELPMALSNRSFGKGTVETVFLPALPALSHVRGTLVRQIAAGGGELDAFLTPAVAAALEEASGR